MLPKTSAFLALYALACIISMTSAAARLRHHRHHLQGESRPQGGRHRARDNARRMQEALRDQNKSLDLLEEEDTGYYRPEARTIDGFKVPALHAMQTYGLTRSRSKSSGGGKERRPIRGSRKAVVVTKKTYLKKEWCKTQPLKQVVRMRGCLRTKILNNFCYGQCNSFFIPKKARRDKNSEAFLSCGFCRPRRFRWILVTLKCPGKNGMRFKRKRVQYIKKCRCMAQDVKMPPMT